MENKEFMQAAVEFYGSMVTPSWGKTLPRCDEEPYKEFLADLDSATAAADDTDFNNSVCLSFWLRRLDLLLHLSLVARLACAMNEHGAPASLEEVREKPGGGGLLDLLQTHEISYLGPRELLPLVQFAGRPASVRNVLFDTPADDMR